MTTQANRFTHHRFGLPRIEEPFGTGEVGTNDDLGVVLGGPLARLNLCRGAKDHALIVGANGAVGSLLTVRHRAELQLRWGKVLGMRR